MINHHYPILNQCSSHHQPVDFSSTYPKLRVTCPSLANLAVSEHRVCPRPKTSRLKGFPKKNKYQSRQSHEHVYCDHHDHSSFPQKFWATQDSPSHLFSYVFHRMPPGWSSCSFPHQAISTPAFNMSWPFCTVRVVSLAKCCNCLSTCAVFRRIRRWECGLRSNRRWRYFKWCPLV